MGFRHKSGNIWAKKRGPEALKYNAPGLFSLGTDLGTSQGQPLVHGAGEGLDFVLLNMRILIQENAEVRVA